MEDEQTIAISKGKRLITTNSYGQYEETEDLYMFLVRKVSMIIKRILNIIFRTHQY